MKIISSNGEVFEIDDDIAKQSSLLQELFVDGVDGPYPLPNVKGSILEHIIEYCNHHKYDTAPEPIDDDPNKDIYKPKRSDDITEWDQSFIQRFTMVIVRCPLCRYLKFIITNEAYK